MTIIPNLDLLQVSKILCLQADVAIKQATVPPALFSPLLPSIAVATFPSYLSDVAVQSVLQE